MLRRALIAWYRRGHREMPWRITRDPYAIWVSEIMLQQTRVETVRGYYARWMTRLPTVRSLAEAPLDEVLALWTGLGYYARARNLKAAAEQLVARDGGQVPRDPERLLALPGIGRYTAGAIASVAYGLAEPILDGNVARVLCRLFLIDSPPEAAATRARLWALAAALVPQAAASDFNQAMMELGATLCSPRGPDCARCPVASRCAARAADRVLELPRKKQRRPSPIVDQLALLLGSPDGTRVLLGRRPPSGLWGGLWEPPCAPLEGEAQASSATAEHLGAQLGLRLGELRVLEPILHELSHRRYRFHPITATARGEATASRAGEMGYEALRWVNRAELEALGLSAWAKRLVQVILSSAVPAVEAPRGRSSAPRAPRKPREPAP